MGSLTKQRDGNVQTKTDLRVPTVTEDDLERFHQSHFTHAPLPAAFMPDHQLEELDEEDDGLGYYPDGVKRTLTNEQIVMFRHSEIQALIKQQEAALEDSESPISSPKKVASTKETERGSFLSRTISYQTTPIQPNFKQVNPKQTELNQKPSNRINGKKRSRPAKKRRKAAFDIEQEQKRRKRNSSSPIPEPEDRHDPKDYRSDGEDRTYRRKAREEDEVTAVAVELDY